jgi:enhancer of mRNA-decapping protein 3
MFPSVERKNPASIATGREDRVLRDITPAATLVEPFNLVSMERIDSSRTATKRNESPAAKVVEKAQKIHIPDVDTDGVEGLILNDHAELSPAQPPVKQKKPRKRKGRKTEEAVEPDVVPAKETQRSTGWRQTPLLEPNPSFQPFATLKKSNKRNGRPIENGWATEDATDVQDMGDFDFAGSLAKFDKKTVFTQIQAEDGTADEDRLVAHNRLPKAKPGTAGGRNLHYTENVLDLPNGTVKAKELWKSEAGDSDEEGNAVQRDSGSGRHSRRAESRVATSRRPQSRKGSSIPAIQPTRTLSVSHSCFFVEIVIDLNLDSY